MVTCKECKNIKKVKGRKGNCYGYNIHNIKLDIECKFFKKR